MKSCTVIAGLKSSYVMLPILLIIKLKYWAFQKLILPKQPDTLDTATPITIYAFSWWSRHYACDKGILYHDPDQPSQN